MFLRSLIIVPFLVPLLTGPVSAQGNPLLQIVSDRVMEIVDTNRDGKVTAQEFALVRQQNFTMADVNGDGKVSREEFTGAVVFIGSELALVWKDQFFAAIDRNADNQLERAEVDAIGDHVFSMADRNGDGFVTPGEVHPSLAQAR